MKPPTILCSLGFISTLGMSDFVLAQESESKTLSDPPCHSRGVQEARMKRAQDNRGVETVSSPGAHDPGRDPMRGESPMAKCGQADRRMEFLVLLLQIMRAPK